MLCICVLGFMYYSVVITVVAIGFGIGVGLWCKVRNYGYRRVWNDITAACEF